MSFLRLILHFENCYLFYCHFKPLCTCNIISIKSITKHLEADLENIYFSNTPLQVPVSFIFILDNKIIISVSLFTENYAQQKFIIGGRNAI